MKRRLVVITAAVSLLGSAAFAEPPKAAASASAGAAQASAKPLILASADGVQPPAPDQGQQGSATPKKPRAARVTTCRCGDPQPTVSDE